MTANNAPIHSLKSALLDFTEQQKTQFLAHTPVQDLVITRAEFIDRCLIQLWQQQFPITPSQIALVAVGGYGRKELHPLSDIDILILSAAPLDDATKQNISDFITQLWDLKLDIGQSVRTLEECLSLAKNDLTIATNLQEARLIFGNVPVFEKLQHATAQPDFWPSDRFYQAKVDEQIARHAKFHNTTDNLEPDIKSSPGGLRDIHTLSWIARRHFNATSLLEMSQFGFLTDAEYRELNECQNILWRFRFALHLQLRRYDNRLIFDHQMAVAEALGYQGEGNQRIETMMKEFYRTTRRIAELNTMLLDLFQQAILHPNQPENITPLNRDFQLVNGCIDARKPALFQARPDTMLDLFLHIAKNTEIKGITAATLRQLRTARRRQNRFLVDRLPARRKFMELMRHPNVLQRSLPLMHRHGVLASYWPQWSHIVGQMQFDLFHIYTVDEHTMRLLMHFKAFEDPDNQRTHPICCDVYPRLHKRELLILAGLFHDIAKGRQGDHSELGGIDAYEFGLLHGLSKPEANLIKWLVENHLLMSVTAQRRDIYDPDVITEFAKQVRDEERLDYLVCLTVADINATNHQLWNSWKRTLLSDLYHATQKALRRGLENPPDVRARIRHNQQLASAILRRRHHTQQAIDQLWQRFKADYFLRHTHRQLAWHAHAILRHQPDDPCVLISKKASRGGTEVFVYAPDRPKLFSTVVNELDRKNLSVLDAKIMTSKDGYVLDTFVVLDQNNLPLSDDRHATLIDKLIQVLAGSKMPPAPKRRLPRRLQHFSVKTQVEYLPSKNANHTRLELNALDSPGLLSVIGNTFAELRLDLLAAKITTIGERAEDFFVLTTLEGKPLNLEEQAQLQHALIDNIAKLNAITSV